MAARLQIRRLARGALGGLLMLLAGCATAPGSGSGPGTSSTLASERVAGPERFGTMMRLGDAARRSGDWAAAITFYRQAIAAAPGEPRGHVALGEGLLAAGNPGAAAGTFQDALELAPDDRDVARGYARALLEAGEPEAAATRFAALVEIDPTDLRAINGLGVAYDLSGRHEEAQAVYRRGLARQPDSLALRNNLGLSLVLSDRPEAAVPILRRVAESPGATVRNRQNLALAHGLAGDLASAERVGRLDLDERAVRQNFAFYTEVRDRSGKPGAADSAAPAGPAPPVSPNGPPRNRGETRRPSDAAAAVAKPTRTPPDLPVDQPIVIKLDARVATVAGATTTTTTALDANGPPAPAPEKRLAAVAAGGATPSSRPAAAAVEDDPNVGSGAAAAPAANAVALEGLDLQLGVADIGSWFLELGEYAGGPEVAAAWRELRRRHGAPLSGLNRLASIHDGRQQLLVGPVASGAKARELCRQLEGRGQTCRPVSL